MSNSTEVSAQRAITVPFHGAELYVVAHNGQPYTPMKPIVEGMGIDWKSQHAKLAANDARWGMVEITIPSAGGMQVMSCLPLRKLFGWLTGLHVGKIKAELRPAVTMYQNECDDVLWQYWSEGVVINPRTAYAVNPGDVLSKEEAETLRQLVEGTAKKLSPDTKVQGKFIRLAWSKLFSHFKVTYRKIPRHELTEAISLINRHTAEWEVVDEPPIRPSLDDAVRVDHAFAMATQIAAKVQRAVFKCVMSGNADWRIGRYLLGMCPGGLDEDVVVQVQPVEADALVLPIGRFPDVIEDSVLVDAETLTRLAATCTSRLGRMAQRAAIGA